MRWLTLWVAVLSACGVKGPPMPPVGKPAPIDAEGANEHADRKQP